MKKTTLTLLLPMLVIVSGCGRSLPAESNIEVPFTSQAPAGDWSEPWQNACEETSIYMIASFYKDDEIKREEAIRHIREIVAAKNNEFAISEDESLARIAEIIRLLGLPWSTEIKENPTVEDLKTELAAGRPIIVPVYFPALQNETYSGLGPDYHVLVLTGYDDADNVFIVNDPGTSSGEGLRFDYTTFLAAIHDLDSAHYEAGKKAVLFTKETNWTDWMDGLAK